MGTTTPAIATTTPIAVEVHRGNNVEALQYAIEYYKDTPQMLKITACESGWRMWDNSGKKTRVLSGIQQPADRGFSQVNEHYHKEEAMAMGMDIENFFGNVEYGKYLYKTQGSKPWLASAGCWSKMTDKELQDRIDAVLKDK